LNIREGRYTGSWIILVMPKSIEATKEILKLERECRAMYNLLKTLEKEELELIQQAKVLAREALLRGYQPHLLDIPAPKRRRTIVKPSSTKE
jgi:hypothetical protein